MQTCDQTTLTTSLIAGGLFIISEILARTKNIKGNSVIDILENVMISILRKKIQPESQEQPRDLESQ